VEPFTFFISYRRQDTAPIALLLKYEIEKRLQFVRVFVDVHDIRHGEPFPERIKQLIDKAHATIILIGKNWMPLRDGNKQAFPNVSRDRDCIDEEDWIVTEIQHSMTSDITYETDSKRNKLNRREILPIFVDCEPNFNQFQLPEAIARVSFANAENINYANWPRAVGPLIENIALKLNLKKRRDRDEYPKPDGGKARTQPVDDSALAAVLEYREYEGWYLDNFGDADVRYLVKTFEFQDFDQAADFMHVVSQHCRVLDHHPEWRNVYKVVQVALTSWDAQRRVTIYDLNLALYMNKVARSISGRR